MWKQFLSIDRERTINHVVLNGNDYYQVTYKSKPIHVFSSLNLALDFLSSLRDNVVYYDFVNKIRLAA